MDKFSGESGSTLSPWFWINTRTPSALCVCNSLSLHSFLKATAAYEALRCQIYGSADNSPSIPAAPFKASPFILIASCLNANCMITYSPSVKNSCRQTKITWKTTEKTHWRNLRHDVAELIKLNLFPYVTSIEEYFSTLDKYKNQRVCIYVIRQKAQNRLLIHLPWGLFLRHSIFHLHLTSRFFACKINGYSRCTNGLSLLYMYPGKYHMTSQNHQAAQYCPN